MRETDNEELIAGSKEIISISKEQFESFVYRGYEGYLYFFPTLRKENYSLKQYKEKHCKNEQNLMLRISLQYLLYKRNNKSPSEPGPVSFAIQSEKENEYIIEIEMDFLFLYHPNNRNDPYKIYCEHVSLLKAQLGMSQEDKEKLTTGFLRENGSKFNIYIPNDLSKNICTFLPFLPSRQLIIYLKSALEYIDSDIYKKDIQKFDHLEELIGTIEDRDLDETGLSSEEVSALNKLVEFKDDINNGFGLDTSIEDAVADLETGEDGSQIYEAISSSNITSALLISPP